MTDERRRLVELTAVEILRAVSRGDLSVETYVDALVERAATYRYLNTFLSLDAGRAREMARAADRIRRRGESVGPLQGLPLVVKDNIDVRGFPTTCHTPALARNQPDDHAVIVQALVDAGALVLGKTTMYELALGSPNGPALGGDPLNPYDPRRMTGGSSSGTAVAIAARLAPAGLGTDTGGSIRIPAALCGIAGLRPTIGRYSGDGIVPVSPTRDTAGPMARTVADLVLLDSVLTGTPPTLVPARLPGLRLGAPRGYFFENLDPPVAEIAERELVRLREAGAELVEADVEQVEALNAATSLPVAMFEAIPNLARYLSRRGDGRTLPELADMVTSPGTRRLLRRLLGEEAVPRGTYEAAMRTYRPALQAAYRRYFETHGVAAIVYPTTPLPARPVEQTETIILNGSPVSTFLAYLRNVDPSSNAGLPGLTVPADLTADGLPVGLAFDAPADHDRELLAIGLAYEVLRPLVPGPPL